MEQLTLLYHFNNINTFVQVVVFPLPWRPTNIITFCLPLLGCHACTPGSISYKVISKTPTNNNNNKTKSHTHTIMIIDVHVHVDGTRVKLFVLHAQYITTCTHEGEKGHPYNYFNKRYPHPHKYKSTKNNSLMNGK